MDRLYQVHTEPVVAGPETVTADRWFQPFSQPLVNAALRAAVVLAVTAGAVGPVAPVATPTVNTGWVNPLSEPARPLRGLNAALQSSFTVDPKVLTLKEATTVDRWFTSLSEPARFAKSAALQPSFTVDPKVLTLPETTTVSRWFSPFSEPPRPLRGLSAALQSSFTVDPKVLTLKEATSVDRWFTQWKDPLKRPPPVALQEDSYTDQKPVVIAATSEDRWHQPFSEPPRSLRGLSAALQQTTTVDPVALTRPEATTVDRWHQPFSQPLNRPRPVTQSLVTQDLSEKVTVDRWLEALSEPLRFARSAALFRVDTQSTLPLPNAPFSDVRWFNNLSEPARPPRGLTAAQQTAFFVDPRALASPETTTVDRWHQPFSKPVVTQRPVAQFLVTQDLSEAVTVDRWLAPLSQPLNRPRPVAQTLVTQDLNVVVKVSLDSWYRRLEEPVRQRPGLAPAQQQFSAVDPVALTKPEATTVDRWFTALAEPVRFRKSAAINVAPAAFVNLVFSDVITNAKYTVTLRAISYTVTLSPSNYTVRPLNKDL